LRYLRWGGDGEAVQPEKGRGVGKGLKTAQNPQRQVHALLGGVLLCQTRQINNGTTAKSKIDLLDFMLQPGIQLYDMLESTP